MNELVLDWPGYRSLPYERRLGLREVESLIGHDSVAGAESVTVSAAVSNHDLLERLTYFQRVRVNGGDILVPLQARLEATASVQHPLGRTPGNGVVHKRQSTRYSTHGLHEYKGKFNPQIVRAAVNLLGVGLNGPPPRMLDPFCGSGTTLVEAAHMGWDAIGIDANPLAVAISNAKVQALKVPLPTLQACRQQLAERLLHHARRLDCEAAFPLATLRRMASASAIELPNDSYLQKWFTVSVLAQIRMIWAEIARVESKAMRHIARVILSDILRTVSLQDPGDLRIRRRSEPLPNYPVIRLFVEALERRLVTIAQARAVLGRVRGTQRALLGDSRGSVAGRSRPTDALFDVVVTSPPYATALPYVDTQRLSLALLGLLTPKELRIVENQLIGSREISRTEREREERAMIQSNGDLPADVLKLCNTARLLAREPGNGFRRRNMPALLFRYFKDMYTVFRTIRARAHSGTRYAMVVGPNRTTLGGEVLRIETPRLLGQVAETAGWKVEETITLDAYQRFDIHSENSIRAEDLIILKTREC